MSRRHTSQQIVHSPLTRKKISRHMKEHTLTLPWIISFDYKRSLLTIILTCTEHTSTNSLTCFSAKRMLRKKKEASYRLLFDDYLHSWYVVYVTIKRHEFAKLFKNSFTYKKNEFIRPSNVSSTSKFAEDEIISKKLL